MNKKLLAAAVAGVFAAPVAFAQSSNVELYGRINAGVDNASATGATLTTGAVNQDYKSRMRQFDTGSRLGVRGSEDLGNGLRAIFQIESGVNSDNGQITSQGGQTNASAGTLGSRPTWVGLQGSFGDFKFGRQDVYWGNGTISQTGPNYINTDTPWITGGAGRVSAGVTRQSNVFSYTTPTMSGLNASLYWSPDTNAGGNTSIASLGQATNQNPAIVNGYNNSENAGAGKNTNAHLLGLTARGAWGPYQAQYDFVTKQGTSDQTVNGFNNFGSPRTYANKLGLAWAYQPGAQVAVIATAIHATNIGVATTEQIASSAIAAATLENLNQTSLSLNWEHLVGGNILLLAQYGQMQKVKGCSAAAGIQANVCDNSQATSVMAGVRYNLSKRSALFASYNKISNGSNQYADYAGGAYQVGPLGATNKGASPQVIAVGMQHNF